MNSFLDFTKTNNLQSFFKDNTENTEKKSHSDFTGSVRSVPSQN